jgi:hypothetical protein
LLDMLALGRSCGVSWTGSYLAGLNYAFGAPVLFQYCFVNVLVGAAWNPWGLWAIVRLLRPWTGSGDPRPTRRGAAELAAAPSPPWPAASRPTRLRPRGHSGSTPPHPTGPAPTAVCLVPRQADLIYLGSAVLHGKPSPGGPKPWGQRRDWQLRRNSSAYPRAWIVHDARVRPLASDPDTRARLLRTLLYYERPHLDRA